jgi:hypothetical protein
MNKRIRELYNQSLVVQNDDAQWIEDELDSEKFAELIVAECLAQVDKVDAMLDDDKEKTGVAWVGLAIAKHFGVKE